MIREGIEADAPAMARLLIEADDARVISAAGIVHMRRTRPERGRMIDLVAEVDGEVVATGAAGLNISTTTEGAAWAFVTVDSRARRQGIGDALGTKLLEHLSMLRATKATSFFRWTEEGERWATATRLVSASDRAAHRGRPTHRRGAVDTDRLPLRAHEPGRAGNGVRSGQGGGTRRADTDPTRRHPAGRLPS